MNRTRSDSTLASPRALLRFNSAPTGTKVPYCLLITTRERRPSEVSVVPYESLSEATRQALAEGRRPDASARAEMLKTIAASGKIVDFGRISIVSSFKFPLAYLTEPQNE